MKKIITSFVALLSAVGCASFLRAAQQTYVVGVSDSSQVTVKDDSSSPKKYNWVKYSDYSYYAFDLNGLSYNLGLVASKRSGYRFDGWYTLSSGKDGSGGPKDCDKKISTDLHITWSEITSKAAISSDWNNNYLVCPKFVKVWTVSASASPPEGGTVSGAGKVDDGATTNLVAKANSGYAFDHWGGFDEPSETLTTPQIKSNTTFVAVFRELKVDKPTVTKSFTYDGNAKTCATAGDHYTVSDNVKTAAGTYTFTATLKDGYHWSDGTSDPYTVEWTIGKAENGFMDGPAITGWTYDGSPSSPTAVAKFSGSSGISYVYYDGSKVKLSGRPSDAGNYYLKATTPGSDNYASVTSDFVSFSIAPKEINTSNITYSDKTETYDGTAKTIVVGYVPDRVTATYSNNSRTDAGSQTATVTFAPENGNYTVSVKSRTATLTIAQATISSLALVESSVTYNGQPHPPIVKSVTTANGKTFTDDSVGWTVSYDRDDFVNAGEIKVSVTGNKNLTGTSYYPQTYTINRARTAEMSASPVSIIYNGKPREPVLTLTNCAEDPDSDSTATEPGTYYVRATPDANHAWSDGSTSSRSIRWTISYQKVTVHFDLNYDGASAPSTRELNYMKGYEFSTPSRTGYDFKGWWTAKEGGTEVTTSTKVERSDEHTLYAHWKAKKYAVTFDGNGGETPSPETKSVTYDSTYGELAVCTRTGYTFAGWYTTAGGGTKVTSGTKVAITADQTLYAHWTANKYEVTYDNNFVFEQWANNANSGRVHQNVDRSAVLTKNVETGSLTLKNNLQSDQVYTGFSKSDDPSENAGYYTFLANENTDYTLSVYIQAGPTDVEVHLYFFDAGNKCIGTKTSRIKSPQGRKNLELKTPERCHHAQIRFDTNVGGETATFQNVKFIDTASFKWIPITTASNVRQVYTYEPNKTYGNLITSPSRTGYTFAGWYDGGPGIGNRITGEEIRKPESLRLYSTWQANNYTVTFDGNGGETPSDEKTKSVTFDSAYGELANCMRTGYTFAGWYTAKSGGTKVEPSTQVTNAANHTLYAHWATNRRIDVSVSPAGAGTAEGAGTYVEGSNVVLTATVTNPGYSFACWNRTNDNVQVSTDKTYSFTVSSSAGYVAVFTGNVYTVTFSAAGGTPASQTVDQAYGSNWKLPTTEPTRDGYEFKGWFTEKEGKGEKLSEDKKFELVPTGPLSVYANLEEITEWTVTFVDPEELSNRRNPPIPVPYEKGETVSEPPSVTDGWSDKWFGEYWIAGWNPPLPQVVSSHMTITAVRESIATVLDCEEQGLVFHRNDNWQVCADDHNAGTSCLKLESIGGTDTVRAALPAGDGGLLTFYWKSDAGKELIVKVSQGGEDYSLPNFVARNTGWNQETIEIRAGGEATVVFTCSEQVFDNSPRLIDTVSWQPGAKPSRTVTVTCGEHGKLKQGSTGAFPHGSDVTLEAEADPGYAFCCWTNDTGFATNENPWTFTVVEEVSYKATFTNAQYVVTLDPNGGTGGDASVIVTYDKPLPDLASTPTRTDGWTFNGYTNAAGVAYYDADGEGLTWDQPNAATLFAQWKAPDEYALTVTVEGRGSVIKNPDASQYVANTTVSLEAKPDVGAAFAQWDDGEKSPTRTVTMTGDITLTATFTNCQYVVTFDPNGGSVTQKTKIVTYGETYGGLPTPMRNGYTFKGWFTQASGGNKVEATTAVTTDADRQKLFAQWDREVGELSKALDCSNLDFAASGGWAVFTNETFAKEGVSCLSNSVPGATLTASLPTAGTLTFWWKGAATDDEGVQLKVKVAEQEMAACMIRKSEQDDKNDKWSCVTIDVDSAKFPVNVSWTCTSAGAYCAVDFVTWTPDAPEHPEPTDADKVTISAAGVKDGKFTLSFSSDERFDYNLLTNANLLIDSWGKMEKRAGTGKAITFEPEIVDGLPQLFYKVETIQKED